MPTSLLRNDIRQYEQLVGEWWRDGGPFAILRALARARADLVPPAGREGATLVDLGCGGGLLAPYVARLGYRHVGLDLVASSLVQARAAGVGTVRADVARVPLASRSADVVVAGEILEHVTEPSTVLNEACRVLRPGGLIVVDTVNATALARLLVVRIGERLAGRAIRGIHDPALFVPPDLVVSGCRRNGVTVAVRGLRPRIGHLLRWLVTRRGPVDLVPTWSAAVLYQAYGVKEV